MASALFLAGVVWGAVAVVAGSTVLAWRQRPRPGATAFAMVMLSATWWVTAASVGLFTTDRAMTVFWSRVEWAGIVYLPVAWLAFALTYTGREEYISRRRLAGLAVVPTATLALALTNGLWHDLLFDATTFHGGEAVLLVEGSFGPWLWVHVAYSAVLLASGVMLVLQMAARRRLLYRGQALALVLVVAPPVVASALYMTGRSPVPFFDPTPYTFVISGAAGIAALTQLQFLESVPVTSRVAHRSVVENVDAGVLVADTDGRIVEANPRARGLLADGGDDTGGDDGADTGEHGRDDGREPALVGESVDEWLPDDGNEILVDSGHRTRVLDVRETALDGSGTSTGRIVLLRDVTERRNRVQRLNVLNRVLRHNLRNEMNVVYGHADRLEHTDVERAAVAEDIRSKAGELVDLANKAREMDAIVDDTDTAPTDLCRVVTIECDRVAADYPDVAVTAETPPGPLFVDAATGTVVRNLVENAAEHNTVPDPEVEVTVTAADGDARVVVADNGPGIPERELAAFGGGLETQLEHASGLGLWLVNWGTSVAGGEVSVADREPTGTRVTLTVPLVGPPDESSGTDG